MNKAVVEENISIFKVFDQIQNPDEMQPDLETAKFYRFEQSFESLKEFVWHSWPVGYEIDIKYRIE